MPVFAGLIAISDLRPNPGVAEFMLSQLVAPRHQQIEQTSDDCIDVALRSRADEMGFYSNSDFVVVADCQFETPDALSIALGITNAQANPGRSLAIAYEKWGESLLERIDGEFAFAIWNKRERQLFCARDRFGRAPFVYAVRPSGLVFASDFLSIAGSLPTPPEINEEWVIEYIQGAITSQDKTPFEGIMRLPPGCALTWSDRELNIRQYWSFSEIGPTVEEVSITKISLALEASVDQRMTDPKTITMLSGGLDSSSISVLARDIRKKRGEPPLPSMSIVFDDFPNHSERPFIEAVLETGGFEPHFVDIKSVHTIAEIDRLVRVQGAPSLARGAPILEQALIEVERLGFSTVLDGHGGDEIISSFGVMVLFGHASDGKWGTLLRELVQASYWSELSVTENFVRLFKSKGQGILAKVFRRISPNKPTQKAALKRDSLLRLDWHQHPSMQRVSQVNKRSNPARHNTEREFQESILSAPLQSHAHEFLRRQFRSRGIRLQVPFWSLAVVEQCLRAPAHEKLKQGVPRSLIRSVMGDRLPADVGSRTSKFDFTSSHVRALKSEIGELKEILSNDSHRVFEYINHDAFALAIEELSDNSIHNPIRAFKNIWTTLNLWSWFELLDEIQSRSKKPMEIQC